MARNPGEGITDPEKLQAILARHRHPWDYRRNPSLRMLVHVPGCQHAYVDFSYERDKVSERIVANGVTVRGPFALGELVW